MKTLLLLCLMLVLLFGFGCSDDTQRGEEEVTEDVVAEEDISEGAVVISQEEFDNYLKKVTWLYEQAQLSAEKSEEVEGVTVFIFNGDLSEEDLKELAKKEALKIEVGEIYFEERNVSALPEEIEEMTEVYVERYNCDSREHMFTLLQEVFGFSREDILRDIEFEVMQEKVAEERLDDIRLMITTGDEEVDRKIKIRKAKGIILEEIMELAEERELIIQ